MAATKQTYEHILKHFSAPVTPHDCGRECADADGPLCCSTTGAVPIAQKAEWKHLKELGDQWKVFKPYDANTKAIVNELADSCMAIECKGSQHCQRDQRSLACRAFPFFPYVTREGDFIGLSHYWYFEDRCWVIGKNDQVTKEFIDEFVQAYDLLFKDDPEELEVYRDFSASMRRVFTRRKQPIPLIARDGSLRELTRKDWLRK